MLRIATRRSALARAQAFQAGRLLQRRTGRPFELVPLATSGDRQQDVPIAQVDVKGMFVDTIRQAVLDGDCDLAVHSYKDLPGEPAPGLRIAAVPEREDPRDVLVSRDGHAFATLPALATVGTSSERRRLQLLRAKPGLQVLPLRGNIDTRLRKVAEGEYDAIVIAFAGLRRLYVPVEAGGVGPLGLPLTAAPLEPGEMLSAPGQGALAIECRQDDADVLAACRSADHPPTHRMVRAERAFQAALGGGCLAAVGALASLTDLGGLELAGMLGDPALRRVHRQTRRGAYGDPEGLGRALADEMRQALAA
jgi:hydroxymethylbilane synthase